MHCSNSEGAYEYWTWVKHSLLTGQRGREANSVVIGPSWCQRRPPRSAAFFSAGEHPPKKLRRSRRTMIDLNRMKTRPEILGTIALSLAARRTLQSEPNHTFGVQADHFILDGKPFVVRSGEMHYARIPREYWRDRLKKMRAMGLNTLCLYSFWNLHEPRPGQYDFSGNLDIATFIRTAQQEGLWVIVRPGPY